MIFLIRYDRPKGKIVSFLTFNSEQREEAANERLLIEVDLNRRGLKQHEVILLEAETEEALRRTHRRYFENAKQIITSSSGKQ